MKKTLICKIVTLVAVGVSLSATSALAGSDAFDRNSLGIGTSGFKPLAAASPSRTNIWLAHPCRLAT